MQANTGGAQTSTKDSNPPRMRNRFGQPVYGPCSSCGLAHSWEYCYRNKDGKRYKPEQGMLKGLSTMAQQPGYVLGDEFRTNQSGSSSM